MFHAMHPATASLRTFNRRPAAFAAACVVALAGAFAAGAQSSKPDATSAVDLRRDSREVNRGPLESGSFSSVVKRVAPGVVKITTSTKAKRLAGAAPALQIGRAHV